MSKRIVLICEMLTNLRTGDYTQWIYYDDGTMETKIVPKGPIFIPPVPFAI